MPAAVAFAPRFCPNADIFFELQADEPGAWIAQLAPLAKAISALNVAGADTGN